MSTTNADVKFRLAVEGASVVSSEMDRVNAALGKVEGFAGKLKNALGLLGVGLSVNYFVGMIKGSIDAADHLNDLSKTTSIAVETLAGLKLAAKQSGGELDGIAVSINKLSVNMGKDAAQFAKLGVIAKDPLQAFKQLADVFSTLKDPQLRAALGAEALGKSWASAGPLLAEGGAKIQEMVDKGTKLSGVTKEMAEKADIFNDSLAAMDAVMGAAKTNLAIEMLPTLTKLTAAFVGAYEEGGKLHAMWIALGGLGALMFTDEFASAKTKLNQVNEDLKKIKKSQDDIKNAGSIVKFLYGSDELAKEASRLNKSKLDLQAEIDKPARDAAARATDAKARIADAKAEAEATRKTTEFLRLNDEARKKAAATAETAIKAQDSFVKGLQKEHDSLILGTELAKLNEAATLGITGAKLKLVTTLLEEDRVYKLAVITAKERAALRQKESDGIDAYMLAQTESYNVAVKGSQDALAAAQAEYDQFGLSKSQIAEITLLTMQSAQAKVNDGTEGFNALQKQIGAQKELIGVLHKIEKRQVGLDTAKAVNEESKKGWEETDRIGRETFIGLTIEGKNFAETVGKSLKTSLSGAMYDLFARPIMLQLYTSVVGGAASGATAGAAGSMVGAGAGSYLAGATGISGVTSAFQAGWAASAAQAAGTPLIAALPTAGATGTAASWGAGMQAAFASNPVGWIALAAVAAYAVFHKEFISATDVGSAGIRWNDQGQQTQVTNAMIMPGNALALQTVNNLGAAYLGFAHQLGINPGDTTFQYQSNTGREGANPNFTMQSLRNGTQSLYQTTTDNPSLFAPNEVALDLPHLQLETSRVILSALESSDLPKSIKGVFDGLVPANMDQAQLDTVLQTAQSFADLHTQLQALPFAALTDMSYATAAALVAASGGMQQLGTNLGTFYSKFYSPKEQTDQTNLNIAAGMTGAGHATNAADVAAMSRDQWRTLVDGSMTDVSAAGIKFTATLLSLSGAFDSTHVAAVTAAAGVAAVDKVLEGLTSTNASLTDQYNKLTMSVAAYSATQTAGMTADQLAMYNSNAAIQANIDAFNAYAATLTANSSLQDQVDVLTGARTQTQVDRTNALAVVTDASTIALMNQVYVQQDLKTATDAAAATLTANSSLQDQLDVLTSARTQTQVDRTNALAVVTDASTIALMNQVYVQQDLKTATDAAAAAQTAFAASLASAMDNAQGGLQSAIAAQRAQEAKQQQATVQAAQALDQAANALHDALASAGQGIADFVKTLRNSIATRANLAASYQTDLLLAKAGDLEASKRIPASGRAYLDSQIANATTQFDATRATARMANELGALPAVKSYQDKLLDAVNATTTAVGGTTGAVIDLNGKLIVDLTVSARSEIVKLISFISNTDKLSPDLLALALKTADTFTKTVGFITGAALPDDLKALALGSNNTLIKTVGFALGSNTLTPDTMALALQTSGSISRTIALAATNLIDPAEQAMVLMTASDITKTFDIAVRANDPTALAIALAQSGSINKLISVSGGDLTPDQMALINGIDTYNKTVTLHVAVDPDSLSATQTLIDTVFGTIDIGAIGNTTGLGGADLTAVLGAYGLERLTNIRAFLTTLDWGVGANASAHTAYAMASQFGVTELDIANAMGYHLADIQSVFDKASIPRFAQGINYLPADMLIQAHQGERIFPAADNALLMQRLQSPQGNNEALVAEIRALRAEVAALRAENSAENRALVKNTEQTSSLLSGRQGVPFLVELAAGATVKVAP